MTFYPIIGIETHVQLNTKTKLFCSCLNEYAPDEPNKNICPFCTGQPGALPTLNKAAVKKAISFGVAISGHIPQKTRWDRKNYFYPDSPSGYQISQYDNPIVEGGKVTFYTEDKNNGSFSLHTLNLTRAHLESDAGKLIHSGNKTYVDFNRCGAPLIEIVSEPELRNSMEAMAYISELQLIVRTIGISDADMDKGQMRFDCNISMQTKEEYKAGKLPSYKVEVKNINSVRALGRAIEYEIKRQTVILEKGEKPAQETRGWRDDMNRSDSQRGKEDAQDYRYFPEPDLQILSINREDIPDLRDLPELPSHKRQRYLDLGLNMQTANTFVSQEEVGAIFDRVSKEIKSQDKIDNLLKTLANIIATSLIAISEKQEKNISDLVTDKNLITLADLFNQRKINNQGLSKALDILIQNPESDALSVVDEYSLIQVSDDNSLKVIINEVIASNPTPVSQYKSGKIQVIGFLVGQCMKQSKGKGNPQKFTDMLKEKLAE